MPARTRKEVQGKEILLAIKKLGDTTFTTVGCAEDITFKSTAGAPIEYSCRSGSGKLPSGDDPQWSISVKGLMFLYATDAQDANVSIADFSDIHLDKAIIDVKVFSEKVGDFVWSGPASVTSFEISAPQSGLAGYSVELDGASIYTRTTVSA